MITLNIPEPTPSLNLIVNKHWSKAREFKVYWHMLVISAKNKARIHAYQPFERSRVTIIRENHRLLERDNFIGGAKYLVDGLRIHGLIVNDNDKHLDAIYQQRKIPKANYPRTLVYIENAETVEAKAA